MSYLCWHGLSLVCLCLFTSENLFSYCNPIQYPILRRQNTTSLLSRTTLTRIFPEGREVDQSEELFITGNWETPWYNAHLESQRSSSVSTTYRTIRHLQSTKFLQCSFLLFTVCLLPASPHHTKCCSVSHFLAFSIQSLSGQFLSWMVMYSESCSLQWSAEHALILSNPRILFLIKPLSCT